MKHFQLTKTQNPPRLSSPAADPRYLFAIEGAMLQFTTAINGFGNNLYAAHLGATDTQIGLVQTIPNVFAMLLLLPLGMLSDRARTSRTMPLIVLLFMVAGYAVMSAVPGFAGMRILFFFLALSLTVGGPVLYNAQWQNFFGDVVKPELRNNILTIRNFFMFFIGIAAPILCGILMGQREDSEGKLAVLQLFFFFCAAATLLQFFVVSFIKPAQRTGELQGMTLGYLKKAAVILSHDKSFLLFFLPVTLFYMSWQFDWSMWFIGQVQYIGFNEIQLSVYNGVFNLGQLLAIGILSRSVRRRGTDYTLSFAALGLISCPLIMMGCSVMPEAIRVTSFTALMTILNAPQCATNLCIVQILLRVAPKECRGMAVSFYTLTITLTNSFMPFLGVKLYTAFGGDYRALILFNIVTFLFRVLTFAMLVWRYRYIRKKGQIPPFE